MNAAEKDEIEGNIDEVIFYNPENGYTVCRFAVGKDDILTVVGSFPPLSPGVRLKIKGQWEFDARFGQQFKADHFTLTLPATTSGIKKFLASGLIRGIGPVLAGRIVARFAAATIDILTKDPERLKEVSGVGEVKLREIKKSWTEHQNIRDLIIFLQEHNVSTNLATKIYRQYGDQSFNILRTNPYQLCFDIRGVGFKTADQIALKLGVDPRSIERVKAYVLYLLEKDNDQGHIFSYVSEIRAKCAEDLAVEAAWTDRALEELLKANKAVREELGADAAIYLPFFYQAQEEVTQAIHKLAGFPCRPPDLDLNLAIAATEKDVGFAFSDLQKRAICQTFEKKILVITGGPGTGKTTIIRAIVDIFQKWGRELLLAAPTGRAAKRLTETTGREAKTIHRVLEFQPSNGTFKRNARNPLRGEALIIDEMSMVDLPLMYHLMKAVPASMRLVLVGDKDQLPSVGPGTVLQDLIDSGTVDVVRLDQIFRQGKESYIVLNAHRVNEGLSLIYPPREDKTADFFFVHREDEEKAFEMIIKLCTWSVPRRLGLSPLSTQIQVISPMYKGLVGVDNLNRELQKRLNPQGEGLKIGLRDYRPRDKVMQLRNDYEKDVFNGDIGTIRHADKAKSRLFIDYDGRTVSYEKDELDDITLAYAVSVHKAQGGEYLAVIMPLLTQHFIMLQRNLFYTALTRARKLSVIVGSFKALAIAIKNDKPIKRNSLVKERLVRLGGRGTS